MSSACRAASLPVSFAGVGNDNAIPRRRNLAESSPLFVVACRSMTAKRRSMESRLVRKQGYNDMRQQARLFRSAANETARWNLLRRRSRFGHAISLWGYSTPRLNLFDFG